MPVDFLHFQFPGVANVKCIFQMRTLACDKQGELAGNISFSTGNTEKNVITSRGELYGQLADEGLLRWCECCQVHGDGILKDPQPTSLDARAADLKKADGMMTAAIGLGLMIKTADCQPVLLAHNSGSFIMALHVGWRGNRANFPGRAVEEFSRHYNISPADILAVRGPSLGPARAEFVNFKREWGAEFKRWYDTETRCMDLWDLTRSQLRGAGIPNTAIYGIDICTASNPRYFFSYRREHHTGRQASLVWMNNK